MTRYLKSEKSYEGAVEGDGEPVKRGLKKARAASKEPKKFPTPLPPATPLVAAFKKFAKERRVSYQILMRLLLMEGLRQLKTAEESFFFQERGSFFLGLSALRAAGESSRLPH